MVQNCEERYDKIYRLYGIEIMEIIFCGDKIVLLYY